MVAIKSALAFAALVTSSAKANMADMLKVVEAIEQKTAATTSFDLIEEIKQLHASSASPVRQELLTELQAARKQASAAGQPSPVRKELIAELQAARSQEAASAVSPSRQELLSELRGAREQELAAAAPSAARLELLAELRAAREQEQAAAAPSAARLEVLAELRAAREQEQAAAAPSAARLEVLAELRAAREQEQAKETVKSPLRGDILAELRAAREQQQIAKLMEEVDSDDVDNRASNDVYNDDLLPWSDEEELLEPQQAEQPSISVSASHVEALNRLLRTLVLSGIALGLAAAAKLPELDMKRAMQAPSQWITLALFSAPLLVVSADYVFVLEACNDLGLVAGCWSLAAMAAWHMRQQNDKVKADK
eukprot:TRINITY_DN1711_c0_g1_i1.p1 TRINITY_DN1711_c0_g1~~TRINITY_DN1711_c0_g1_i1.p1  ORF type:complete len:368 (-),score=158.84 TRINITY_DN1711_c0_g1_i1:51-1154(-)